jgi:hypothetical protein
MRGNAPSLKLHESKSQRERGFTGNYSRTGFRASPAQRLRIEMLYEIGIAYQTPGLIARLTR